METQVLTPNPGPHDLAQQILTHQNPSYSFSFSPFLLTSQRFGISHTRPVCKAYLQGHCPMGNACPDRHVMQSNNSNFNNLVCKHWLRGLCKKGESCEFLHEYNLRKMPECNFFVRNGYCSNGDECLYLHIDPNSRLPPCPWYERGFCPLGPTCSKKHVRKILCEFYLTGFCPEGPQCKRTHPRYPSDLAKPTVRVEKTAEEIEEEQRVLREHAEREEEKEREKYNASGEGGERGRGRGGRWFGGGRGGRGGQDGQRRQRARGHY